MSENILEVRGLTKSYKDLCAVNGLSLSVKNGQIFGLLGPNGAGKTTTIECILGTEKFDTGSVKMFGMDVTTQSKTILKDIGVQFQANFYPDRIRVGEMCEMMASLYNDTVNWHSLLKQFGLGEKLNSDVSQLSGGERQKLSVLIALINNPKFVILDELTTGLDPKARRDVWKILKLLNSHGLSIFLTSHYMDEVEYLCDYIVILNKGTVLVSGSPKEVVAMSGQTNLEEAYLFYIGEGDDHESL